MGTSPQSEALLPKTRDLDLEEAPPQEDMADMAEAKRIIADADLQKVRVQQFQRIKDSFACDFNNWYTVMDADGAPIFYVKEDSTCVERNCCSGACKAWRMDMYLPGDSKDISQDDHKPFMHLERPFTFTCCCLNRPTVHVSEFVEKGNSPTGRELGTLYDPCTCCNLQTTIIPAAGTDNSHLKIVGSPCQIGICCKCPGNTIDFAIQNQDDSEVAHLTKIWKCGDIAPLCSKEWSTFDMEFKEVSKAEDRLMIVATSLFVQLLWFDAQRNNDNNDNSIVDN